MSSYYSTYAENVFPAGREALTTGKFHDMFRRTMLAKTVAFFLLMPSLITRLRC